MSTDDRFYLRMTGGKIFGPIDLSTLRQWACDGRVEPSATISVDREHWTRATDIPELEMEWVVENAPGQFYGPTHRSVVDDFIKSGALVDTARFYRDMRGGLADRAEAEAAMAEAESMVEDLNTSLAAVNSRLADTRDQLEESRASYAQSEERLRETRDLLASSRRELSEAEARCAKLEADNSRLAQAYAKQADVDSRLLADKQTLVADKASLEAEKQRIESARQALELDLRKLQADRDSFEADCRRLQDENLQQRKELDSLKEEFEEYKLKQEAEAQKVDVLVPEVLVEGMPPKAQTTFVRPVDVPATASASKQNPFGGGGSPFGGAGPTSLADLERAAQAELARMRASGAKGFFFGRKRK